MKPLPSQAPYEDTQEEDCLMSPAGTKRTSQSSYVVAVSSSMCHALLDVPACYAGYRQPCIDQAPGATDGGGGEKESSVLELCSLESVCGQACVYRHIAGFVFTTIFINHKYSCNGVFNFILPSQAPYEDTQEEDCLMSPAGTKRTSQSSYVVAVSSSMCHALLDVPACYAGYRQPCIDQAPGAN